MSELRYLSKELSTSERTLRRAVQSGLIKANRPGPRRLTLGPAEQRYIRRSWPLLSRLRRHLRNEHNVRTAVLFGSAARGTSHSASDVDLLVSLRDDQISRLADLAGRLSAAAGRPVQLLRLRDAKDNPTLLAEIVDEGRVLIDRDGEWGRMRRSPGAVRRAAQREQANLERRAVAAVKVLTRS